MTEMSKENAEYKLFLLNVILCLKKTFLNVGVKIYWQLQNFSKRHKMVFIFFNIFFQWLNLKCWEIEKN